MCTHIHTCTQTHTHTHAQYTEHNNITSLFLHPITVDKRSTNFQRLTDVLKKLNLSLDITTDQLAASGRSLLLFLTHLYIHLPSLVPKVGILI